jgi:hypothetical protein
VTGSTPVGATEPRGRFYTERVLRFPGALQFFGQDALAAVYTAGHRRCVAHLKSASVPEMRREAMRSGALGALDLNPEEALIWVSAALEF